MTDEFPPWVRTGDSGGDAGQQEASQAFVLCAFCSSNTESRTLRVGLHGSEAAKRSDSNVFLIRSCVHLLTFSCSLLLKVSASPQLPNHIKTFCNGPKLQLGQPCCLQAPAVQHSIYSLLFLQIFSYSIQFKIVFSVLFHQSSQGDIARFR